MNFKKILFISLFISSTFIGKINFFKFHIENNFLQRVRKLANDNNSKALNVWKNYGNNIGMCLCHVIGLLNPNYISIGGGVSKANKYFHNYIIEVLETKCLTYDKKKINISYDEDNLNIFYGWF